MAEKATRVNQGDLFAKRAGVHGPSPEEPEGAGVRASIVAEKLRNGSGAKGTQEGGCGAGRTMMANPARVPERAKPAGRPAVNPSFWPKRMLVLSEVPG
jgi:hypothetical protein